VRSKDSLSDVEEDPKLNVIEASILDMEQPLLKAWSKAPTLLYLVLAMGNKSLLGNPNASSCFAPQQ
jgi:hypothetical protein